MKQFKISGNFFKITDTDTGVQEYKDAASNTVNRILDGDISFYSKSTGLKRSVEKYNIDNIVNGNDSDSPFASIDDVETYLDDNTGFNTPGATGEDLNKYVAITTQNTTIELAVATETYCTTSAAAFTFTLQTPISGRVNESVVIFKTSTTPIITHPIDTIWLGATPTFSASETWVVVYEQVYNGTDYVIYGNENKKV